MPRFRPFLPVHLRSPDTEGDELLNKRLLIKEIHHPGLLCRLSGPCVQRRGWCRVLQKRFHRRLEKIIRAVSWERIGRDTNRKEARG